eukprot:355382-Chlamydomonas_euryale.AAC.2
MATCLSQETWNMHTHIPTYSTPAPQPIPHPRADLFHTRPRANPSHTCAPNDSVPVHRPVPHPREMHLHGAQAPRRHGLQDVNRLVDVGLSDAHAERVPVQDGLEHNVRAIHDDDRHAAMQHGVLDAPAPSIACDTAQVGEQW